MMQGKIFISPGAWFSMVYPSDWNEFEDTEGTFLFYNPDVWTGNFRISAYKEDLKRAGAMNYGKESVKLELKENPSAELIKVGALDCAYSKEMFQEGGNYYTTHLWITGIDNIAFECSFTVPKGSNVKEAESVIATLDIRREDRRYPAEIIPVRLAEIFQINESYEWIVSIVKRELKKDFQGIEEDLPKLQQIVDDGVIGLKKKEEWLSLGITICSIVANEVDGWEWMTLIDGNREAPVLQHENGRAVDPMKLAWSKIKLGEKCNVEQEYKLILSL